MRTGLITLLLIAVGTIHAELIDNGGFEANSGNGSTPSGWVKDFNCYGAFSGAAYSGLFGLHPGNSGGLGGCYQDITTVVGRWYDVKLWMQNFNFASGTIGNVKVLIGNPGSDVYTFENGISTTNKYSLTGLINQNLSTNKDGSWSQRAFQFQAVGTTLRFGVYNAPFSGNWSTNVDEVAVEEATRVPAMNPDPQPDNEDGTVGVAVGADVEVVLNWTSGPDPNGILAVNPDILVHYIYMSSDQNVSSDPNLYYIGQTAQVDQIPDNSYGPLTLHADGSYKWSIEEGLDDGTGIPYAPGNLNNIPGPVWTFDTVKTEAAIITNPKGDIADPDASFTVSAIGAENYQWYKVATPDIALTDGGPYSGTQTATLTVTGATLAEEGQYYCVVSNSIPSQATSAAAYLWTKRLMGHWKFDNDMLDSVGDTVAGAPAHNGSIVVNDTIIGIDFGPGGSTNHFNEILVTGNRTIPAGSVIDLGGAVAPGVGISVEGTAWTNNDGTNNGGVPYPFNNSNVDDWMGSGKSVPIVITFSGLNDSKTYDFMVHTGWAGRNMVLEVSSSDGKTVGIDTSPAGAPNVGLISDAVPTGGVLQFTVVSTNADNAAINAAALITQTTYSGPNYASGININAIMFSNENAFVEIADSDFFGFYFEGFTASVWYKENAAVGWRLPFSKVSQNPLGGWLFGVDGTVSNEVSLIIEPDSAWLTSGPNVDYGDGQWHLMTATYDPDTTTLRLYSDGDYVSQALVDMENLTLAAEPVSIGGRLGEYAVSGIIDDTRLYSYPLTAVEIAELYTEFKPGESVCVSENDAEFELLDVNDDCKIDLSDLAMVAGRWLECLLVPAGACN